MGNKLVKAYDLGGSVEDSAKINRAASVIRSNHLRGLHLLELNKFTFDENASQPENAFLFQMMEINEEIDDAKTLSDLDNIKSENDAEVERLNLVIFRAFEEKDFSKALDYLNEMKYRERVKIRLEEKVEFLQKI